MATPIMVSVNTDESRFETAVVALMDKDTWLVIGPSWRAAGLSSFAPFPSNLRCPVVDLSGVQDDKALQFAISAHTGNLGIFNLEELFRELAGLGAVISYSHCNEA